MTSARVGATPCHVRGRPQPGGNPGGGQGMSPARWTPAQRGSADTPHQPGTNHLVRLGLAWPGPARHHPPTRLAPRGTCGGGGRTKHQLPTQHHKSQRHCQMPAPAAPPDWPTSPACLAPVGRCSKVGRRIRRRKPALSFPGTPGQVMAESHDTRSLPPLHGPAGACVGSLGAEGASRTESRAGRDPRGDPVQPLLWQGHP